jgi:hypothetical protein
MKEALNHLFPSSPLVNMSVRHRIKEKMSSTTILGSHQPIDKQRIIYGTALA